MIARNAIADSNARNAEILKAMGFAGRAVARFDRANAEHLALQTRTNDISGTFGADLARAAHDPAIGDPRARRLSHHHRRTLGRRHHRRSVASARALAPVDLAIGNWKSVVGGAHVPGGASRRRWSPSRARAAPMELPAPQSTLKVEKITVAAPGSGRVLLSEVEFELKAGQALGVIGPSGGGKTTLVRALTGIWPVLRGSVRLDDAN